MKRKIALTLSLVMLFCLTLTLSSCSSDCPHRFDNTCDPTCRLCGYVRHTIHIWQQPDCASPEICINCSLERGDAVGHDVDHELLAGGISQICKRCYHTVNHNDGVQLINEADEDIGEEPVYEPTDEVIEESTEELTPEAVSE